MHDLDSAAAADSALKRRRLDDNNVNEDAADVQSFISNGEDAGVSLPEDPIPLVEPSAVQVPNPLGIPTM